MDATAGNFSGIDDLKKNSGWLIALGIVLLLLGILALSSPLVAGIAVELLVGSFLLIGGMVQAAFALSVKSWGARLLSLSSGILSILCGGLIIAHPLLGLNFLTLLLAAFFVVEGFSKMVSSFQLRPAKGWGWALFSGLVGVLLGVMIWTQWPLSGAWAIGTLVGINILFSGSSMMAMGLAARR